MMKEKTELGFIAQQVEETLNKAGVTNNGIISKDDAGMYSVRYNDFIAPIVRATQELNDKVERLLQQNELQQQTIDQLNKKLESQEKKK
jgi:trimeric autotransporter adhesin